MKNILLKVRIEGYNIKGKYRTERPVATETVSMVVSEDNCKKIVENMLPNVHERILNGVATQVFGVALEDDTSMVVDTMLEGEEE